MVILKKNSLRQGHRCHCTQTPAWEARNNMLSWPNQVIRMIKCQPDTWNWQTTICRLDKPHASSSHARTSQAWEGGTEFSKIDGGTTQTCKRTQVRKGENTLKQGFPSRYGSTWSESVQTYSWVRSNLRRDVVNPRCRGHFPIDSWNAEDVCVCVGGGFSLSVWPPSNSGLHTSPRRAMHRALFHLVFCMSQTLFLSAPRPVGDLRMRLIYCTQGSFSWTLSFSGLSSCYQHLSLAQGKNMKYRSKA